MHSEILEMRVKMRARIVYQPLSSSVSEASR